jgi:hypothetical protein
MTTQPPEPPAEPHPDLRSLDVLVGSWAMTGRDLTSGEATSGQLSFEWMEGGYFLVQRVDMDGEKGIEYIRHDPQTGSLTSNYFGTGGNAFTYVWRVEGDTLRIWFGAAGSPAGFTGKFSDDRNTITGRWEWPGGGYEATIVRQ